MKKRERVYIENKKMSKKGFVYGKIHRVRSCAGVRVTKAMVDDIFFKQPQ